MGEIELTWENSQIQDETLTESEIKAAESAGTLPAGVYLAEVVESKPVQKEFKEYSPFAANLKFKVIRAILVNGHKPEGDAGELLEGKNFYDDIVLAHPREKDGMKNRRILAAKRLGLIPATSTGAAIVPAVAWQKDVIGKQAIVTFIHEAYTDKNGNAKVSPKVAFDGYEHVSAIATKYVGAGASAAAVAASADTADI